MGGMESQFEDIAQREDEYLSGRYDCDALAESLRDLFVAVHRESDQRQKQISCLDLRLSQRWQHTQALQQQIEAVEHRVKPLLDDGLPMLQQVKDSMEELDGDVKHVRLASERALAEFTARMAELERNVCSISLDTPNELPSPNGVVGSQQHTVVTSCSSCSVGQAEAKAFTGCLKSVRDEVGQDDHCGGNTSHTCSSTEAVSFSATSITLSATSSLSPRTSRQEPSVRGRVRRLVRQFTDGGGVATQVSGATGARTVNTRPLVESLDVTS